MTLDDLIIRAKASRLPLRLAPPPDPCDTEIKIILSLQFYASYLESSGKMGDLVCLASRLESELAKIRKAIG